MVKRFHLANRSDLKFIAFLGALICACIYEARPNYDCGLLLKYCLELPRQLLNI